MNLNLKKSSCLILKSLALFFVLFFNFAFLSPRSTLAQVVPCSCYHKVYCNETNGALSDVAISTCGPSNNLPCFMICPGISGNPSLSPIDPANTCVNNSDCVKSSSCTPCNLFEPPPIVLKTVIDNGPVLNQFCRSGAYCSMQPNGCSQTSSGAYVPRPGLISTVFKQCFCGIADLVQNIVNIGYAVVGTLSVGMFCIGGYKYLTCQNNPEKINEAKATLTYAVGGLVFVLLSISILSFLDVQLAPWGIRFLRYS